MADPIDAKTVYVLNGPALDPFATGEAEKCGHTAPNEVEKLCRATAERFGLGLVFRQSDAEDEQVGFIHEATARGAAGLVFSPAAAATASIAIKDAIRLTPMPAIEIHITNIHARESFRQNSYVSKAAKAVIAGFGIEGYALAIAGLAGLIGIKAKA